MNVGVGYTHIEYLKTFTDICLEEILCLEGKMGGSFHFNFSFLFRYLKLFLMKVAISLYELALAMIASILRKTMDPSSYFRACFLLQSMRLLRAVKRVIWQF